MVTALQSQGINLMTNMGDINGNNLKTIAKTVSNPTGTFHEATADKVA